MTGERSARPDMHVLLIGIDHYMPNELPGGIYYPSLGGCVRDINNVQDYLRSTMGPEIAQLIALTATAGGSDQPAEPPELWPTYENMVGAFSRLADTARPGERVYIHYSGHGGRTATIIPGAKGPDGLDESLVPTDIGDSEARYLRDVELARLLKGLVDKGLLVTVVFDSCHSGGATRGRGGTGDAAVRGVSAVDRARRPGDSLVAPVEELAETWRALSPEGATRNVKLGSGWLPEPRGYVLLAACRPSELAYEFAFDGMERNGALTYWLLKTLRQAGPGVPLKQLHDTIAAKVRSRFEQQMPMLQGDAGRSLFGGDAVQLVQGVDVIEVDSPNERVLLNTGQAQMVRKGAQFAVYPPGVKDFTDLGARQAIVEITDLAATDSWAKVVNRLRPEAVEQGAQAVLVDVGDNRLRRTVYLVREDATPAARAALDKVEAAIGRHAGGFVEPAGDEEPADFQVAVNEEKGAYEIWDPAGTPVGNLRPDIRIDERDAAARVAQRLVHLAKYRNIEQLDNFDPMSPLASKLVVELVGRQADYDPADRPEPEPFDDPGHAPVVRTGEWVFVRVKNASSRILNVAVLDLQPDWGVTQVYPSQSDTAFMPFDPGQEQLLPLKAGLPEGYAEGADVIKVLATVGPTDFRWLELPSLDIPPVEKSSTRGGPASPLDSLLASVAGRQLTTRNVTAAANPTQEWAVAQVRVQIEAPGPADTRAS